jgi:ketosteroid isomerase-like protein
MTSSPSPANGAGAKRSSSVGKIGAAFDVIRFDIRSIVTKDDVIRCQVNYELRHTASGEILDGTCRLVFEVRDGRIVREREYNDVERMRAFMRLCEGSEQAPVEVSRGQQS